MIDIVRRLVSVRVAAATFAVSERTIRRWVQAGKIDAIQLADRTTRIVIQIAPAGVELTSETFGFGTGKTMRLPADFLVTGAKATPADGSES